MSTSMCVSHVYYMSRHYTEVEQEGTALDIPGTALRSAAAAVVSVCARAPVCVSVCACVRVCMCVRARVRACVRACV